MRLISLAAAAAALCLAAPAAAQQPDADSIAMGAMAGLQELEGTAAEVACATLDLFEGLLPRGELDMQATVEDVRVNTGPPAWTKAIERP